LTIGQNPATLSQIAVVFNGNEWNSQDIPQNLKGQSTERKINMDFLSFVYKFGIWISIPAFFFSVVLLIRCIAGVIRTGRRAQLLSVPLVERQEIEFSRPGRVVLCMEGPILSRRFARLKYQLTGPDGITAKSRPVLFRMRTTGFTKAKMELKVYEIILPGRYVFQIHGLGGEKPSDSEHRMVFTRPNRARTFAYVIGITAGAIFTILSVVLFFMRLLKVAGT
jgi:hypothetical protein